MTPERLEEIRKSINGSICINWQQSAVTLNTYYYECRELIRGIEDLQDELKKLRDRNAEANVERDLLS